MQRVVAADKESQQRALVVHRVVAAESLHPFGHRVNNPILGDTGRFVFQVFLTPITGQAIRRDTFNNHIL